MPGLIPGSIPGFYIRIYTRIYNRILYQDFIPGFYTRIHHAQNPKQFWQTFWPGDPTGQKSRKRSAKFWKPFWHWASNRVDTCVCTHRRNPDLRCGSFYDGPMGHRRHQKIKKLKTVGGFRGEFGCQEIGILESWPNGPKWPQDHPKPI